MHQSKKLELAQWCSSVTAALRRWKWADHSSKSASAAYPVQGQPGLFETQSQKNNTKRSSNITYRTLKRKEPLTLRALSLFYNLVFTLIATPLKLICFSGEGRHIPQHAHGGQRTTWASLLPACASRGSNSLVRPDGWAVLCSSTIGSTS